VTNTLHEDLHIHHRLTSCVAEVILVTVGYLVINLPMLLWLQRFPPTQLDCYGYANAREVFHPADYSYFDWFHTLILCSVKFLY
jgi:hypothetical protein